ncbi:MAG TPA: ABC transporter substrate-binding protein [Bosea sp. (in: a-proteobacteria)]|jgi:glycine betaine/proline transport system substrate-binding protein|uniref:ABC transporter substrate-binding protein n=1 Tax=Bosea sp. (in: a-proteobacteria) TaxID=1871050 RepID=UPI002E153FF5|nr:ABC transporter substrate-binding protein [Bosea sp. (in: a-proteobacteria)]
MSMKAIVQAGALALGLGLGAPAMACELSRPLKMAGLDYDSAAFHTAVASAIAERGFGCKVERVPGAIAPLVNGLARGDVDIVMEIWLANPVEAWVKASEAGRVTPLGTTFPDANEGWFVPRYLVAGPEAKAPDLKAVSDLGRYKALFADPEEPAKGRFYNCVAGWVCEGVNTKKLAAYGLAADFTNTRGGSGEALVAAIESSLKRKRPVLFYYWGPSWLLGAYDLVKLEEPAFDPAIWAELKASDAPKRATAYPTSRVVIGANVDLEKQAPQLAGFFKKYGTTSELTSRMLADAREKGLTPEQQALVFLKSQPAAWRDWLPAEIAAKVTAGL